MVHEEAGGRSTFWGVPSECGGSEDRANGPSRAAYSRVIPHAPQPSSGAGEWRDMFILLYVSTIVSIFIGFFTKVPPDCTCSQRCLRAPSPPLPCCSAGGSSCPGGLSAVPGAGPVPKGTLPNLTTGGQGHIPVTASSVLP